MTEKPFEKMDQDWMSRFKNLREREIPMGDKEVFARRVEKQILVVQNRQRQVALAFGIGIPVLLVVAFFLLNRQPVAPQPVPVQQPEVKKVEAVVEPVQVSPPVNESEILSDLELLQELGEWDVTDNQQIGIPIEASFAELEMAETPVAAAPAAT